MSVRSVLLVALVACPALACGDTDVQLQNRVRSALAAYSLVRQPNWVDPTITRNVDSGVDQVEVFDRHDKACGGDPAVRHRLFEVLADRKTHRMGTDAADPVNGTMAVLD